VPLRALKIVRGGRFVLGQTALNHVYFEIDRRSKTIGFARWVRVACCVLRVGGTCFGLWCGGCWLRHVRACVWTCVCLVSAWLVLWRLD